MCEKTHGRTAKVSQRRQPDAFPGGIWAVNRHMGRHPDWERPKLRRCEQGPLKASRAPVASPERSLDFAKMARHFFQNRKSRLWHASRYRIQQLADLAASRAERVRRQLADAHPPRGLRRASPVLASPV